MAMFGSSPREVYEASYGVLQNQPDQSALQRESTPGVFEGDKLEALGTGVFRGWSRGASVLANVSTPALRPIAKTIDETFGSSLDEWLLSEQEKANKSFIDSTIDPATNGAVSQILFGVGDVLTTAATMKGAPIGTGAIYGVSQAGAGISEGLDTGTAVTKGVIEGAAMGVSVALPAAISGGLAYRAATGAALNVAVGVPERLLVSSVLKARGYDEMAQQYQAFDATSILTELALGAAFGGLLGPRAKAKVGDTSNLPPKEVIAPSVVDAALTASQISHAEIESAPGIPVDAKSRKAHANALDVARESIVNGESVNVESILKEAEFVGRPQDIDALKIIADEFEKVGATDIAAKVKALEDEARLRGLEVEESPLYSRTGGSAYIDAANKVVRALKDMGFDTNVQRSQVSGSQYIYAKTPDYVEDNDGNVVSGKEWKIRVSDHKLPNQYEQADIDVLSARADSRGDAIGNWVDAISFISEKTGVTPKGNAKKLVNELKALNARLLEVDRRTKAETILSRPRESSSRRRFSEWLDTLPQDAELSVSRNKNLTAKHGGRTIFFGKKPHGMPNAVKTIDDAREFANVEFPEYSLAIRKAYGSRDALNHLIDSDDDGVRSIGDALVFASRTVADADAAIARGELYPMSIYSDLLEAANKIKTLRENGASVSDWLKTLDQVDDQISPEARLLATFFERNIGSSQSMADGVMRFYDNLHAAGDPRKASALEAAQPEKTRLLADAIDDIKYSRNASEYLRELGIDDGASPEQKRVYRSEIEWKTNDVDAVTGFPVWSNNDVSLSSPRDVTSGHDVFYMPFGGERAVQYDIRGQNGEVVGYAVLEIDGGFPTKILDIEVDKSLRGQRYGEKTVAAIAADAGEIGVWHIIPSSRSWWERVGVRQTDEHHGLITFDDYADARAVRENAGVLEKGPRFSRERTSRASVNDLTNAFRAQFGKDADRLIEAGRVKLVQSVKDLPGGEHPLDVAGMFWRGQSWIVADNTGITGLRGRVLHEIGVHASMKDMLGDELYADTLNRIESRLEKDPLFKQARELAKDRANKPEHVQEETLAYLVENAPELPIVRRIIAAVRQWVYRATGGRFVDLTQADLQAMAAASLRKYAREANARPDQSGAPMYLKENVFKSPDEVEQFHSDSARFKEAQVDIVEETIMPDARSLFEQAKAEESQARIMGKGFAAAVECALRVGE